MFLHDLKLIEPEFTMNNQYKSKMNNRTKFTMNMDNYLCQQFRKAQDHITLDTLSWQGF